MCVWLLGAGGFGVFLETHTSHMQEHIVKMNYLISTLGYILESTTPKLASCPKGRWNRKYSPLMNCHVAFHKVVPVAAYYLMVKRARYQEDPGRMWKLKLRRIIHLCSLQRGRYSSVPIMYYCDTLSETMSDVPRLLPNAVLASCGVGKSPVCAAAVPCHIP